MYITEKAVKELKTRVVGKMDLFKILKGYKFKALSVIEELPHEDNIHVNCMIDIQSETELYITDIRLEFLPRIAVVKDGESFDMVIDESLLDKVTIKVPGGIVDWNGEQSGPIIIIGRVFGHQFKSADRIVADKNVAKTLVFKTPIKVREGRYERAFAEISKLSEDKLEYAFASHIGTMTVEIFDDGKNSLSIEVNRDGHVCSLSTRCSEAYLSSGYTEDKLKTQLAMIQSGIELHVTTIDELVHRIIKLPSAIPNLKATIETFAEM